MRIAVLAGADHPLSGNLRQALADADGILLAGGIGSQRGLDELSQIAPLTVIVGHRDFLAFGDRFPESAELDLAGARVLLTHMIGSPPELLPSVRERLEQDPPDVIVHGQAPRPDVSWIGGTLFLCPGQASGQRPTCGILDIEGPGRITAHVLDLA